MRVLRKTSLLALIGLALTLPSIAQAPTPAPKVMGFAVQGMTINLDYFKGKQQVLVVFYRTEA